MPVSQAVWPVSKNYWNRVPVGSPFPVTEPFLERAERSVELTLMPIWRPV